ncbi:MAG TPA: hypothetical protein VFX43_13915 [Chitinophagaceae bacterium]|jgi:hypothetical protein|nr:hypothetical protein [Chitinophagaceae bacterium]
MNHMDDIEKFISDHREAFDDTEPDATIWKNLQPRLAVEISGAKANQTIMRRLSRSSKRWISAAAVLLLCISLAAFVRTYQVKKQIMDRAIPTDLRDAQAYYEHRITVKIDRIRSISSQQTNQPDTSLWQLFGQRDAEYNRLRKALQENPGNAHVRAAFVEYYRSRLEVLNRIEDHLEENALQKK